MHSILGQRDIERDDLVEDTLFDQLETIGSVISFYICCISKPIKYFTVDSELSQEESESVEESQEEIPAPLVKRARLNRLNTKNPRESSGNRPGTSGLQNRLEEVPESEVILEEQGPSEERTTPRSFQRV